MLSVKQEEMVVVFERHVRAELEGDLRTSMATMAVGVEHKDVSYFYSDNLAGKFFPPDVQMNRISRTVGEDQIVDEFFISFTHTTVVDWLLPNLAPTGKKVELAVAVIVGFKDGKISHECISWDHTAVLTQIGLVGPEGPPLAGMGRAKKAANADSVPKLANPKLPSRAF